MAEHDPVDVENIAELLALAFGAMRGPYTYADVFGNEAAVVLDYMQEKGWKVTTRESGNKTHLPHDWAIAHDGMPMTPRD